MTPTAAHDAPRSWGKLMSEKRYVVRLTAEERSALESLVKTGKVPARKRIHADVLLKADQGEHGPSWTDERISEATSVVSNSVKHIRQRFVEDGLAAALDRKKQRSPSRPRKLDGRAEARIIALACGPPPEGRAKWTLRLLASKVVELGICEPVSHTTVWETLKKTS